MSEPLSPDPVGPAELACWATAASAAGTRAAWRQRSRIFFTVTPPAGESSLARRWLALLSDIPADERTCYPPAHATELVFWRLVRGSTPLALGAGVATTLGEARALANDVQERADGMLVRPLFGADGANSGWYAVDGDRAVLRGLPDVQLHPVQPTETSLAQVLSSATFERYVHHAGRDPLGAAPPSRRLAAAPRSPALLVDEASEERRPGVAIS